MRFSTRKDGRKVKNKHKLNLSIHTPWWILHFAGLSYNGMSCYHVIGTYKGIIDPQRISNPKMHNNLTHYDKRGRVICKTIRNFLGEPNHYDPDGKCVGYSRRQSSIRLNHYDCRGNLIGYSFHFIGIFSVHHMMAKENHK